MDLYGFNALTEIDEVLIFGGLAFHLVNVIDGLKIFKDWKKVICFFVVKEFFPLFHQIFESLLGHDCVVTLKRYCWAQVIVEAWNGGPVGEAGAANTLPCYENAVDTYLRVNRLHTSRYMVHDLHHAEVLIVYFFNHFSV